MDLTALIEAMSKPCAYPHSVDEVQVRQTHISVVFLAGDYVYKVKKPVKFGFVDFSTLERRLHFCAEEVRLNRRLAPQVYKGVVPVAQSEKGMQVDGQGPVVEWAVKMQRLPDSATLQASVLDNSVTCALVEKFAQRVATFHRDAESNGRIAAHGRYDVVTRVIDDVLSQSRRQVGTTVSSAVFARINALFSSTLNNLHALIEERAGRGMPRDCHGDLHLDHVYYFPEERSPDDLTIIDCIEFNERLRCIDPIADMAFPVMDFIFFGRRDLANAFTEAYFAESRDAEGRALLPLYVSYRAAVRAMVEGLELGEQEVPESEHAAARERARAHWWLALSELETPGAKPCLLLVMGLPGTGKSRLAQGLAERARFSVIRSDVVRKELAGIATHKPVPADLRDKLYSPEWSARTYAECLIRAEQMLFEGRRVLIDATFREEHQRKLFLQAAVRAGVHPAIIVCHTQPETARRRLESRQGDASDADWAVYLRLAAKWEPPTSLETQFLHMVSTEGSPDEAIDRAMDALERTGI